MHQVPVDVTVALLKSAMQAHAAGGREDFLIDGFPRNQDNVEGWDRVMCGSGVELCFALHFECGQDLMVQRLLLRITSEFLQSLDQPMRLPSQRLVQEGVTAYVLDPQTARRWRALLRP